jgi:hypothetical protein
MSNVCTIGWLVSTISLALRSVLSFALAQAKRSADGWHVSSLVAARVLERQEDAGLVWTGLV